ncbi:hypothetical protein SH661x_001415 [Planctomicrobium sp. SH661]|uniref:hypothetical protein n=1 Tax=Planctomicrobium sp. SH661 TaxID=3448124 RepID=UPI003F5C092B
MDESVYTQFLKEYGKFTRAMTLRDHLEIAVLVSRVGNVSVHSPKEETENGRITFWKQVKYLEYLWSKEVHLSLRGAIEGISGELVEEILASRLLIRVMAALTNAKSAWDEHQHQFELIIEELGAREQSPAAATRTGKLLRRLDHWGDFLISRFPDHEHFATDMERAKEFRELSQCAESVAWPLVAKGISHVIPSRGIRNVTRGAVHRLLQSAAVGMIPPSLFMPDGRMKPHLLQRIEWGHHCRS